MNAGLIEEFTSTGAKFLHHRAALEGLRDGRPRVVVTHVMPTDVCNHRCAFCSVQARDGDTLDFDVVTGYLDKLLPFGLKAVILSGGGNPILYRRNGRDFNDLVDAIAGRGLEIGLITNGMALAEYTGGRKSWKTVKPETLDKLAWVRISLAGLDHDERRVEVPDIDRTKTTLGFSYVYHDIYVVPEEPHHGKVSTEEDALRFAVQPLKVWRAEERFEELTERISEMVRRHRPAYVRLLPNCLEPDRIDERCARLREMAARIDPAVVFVQYKPPAPPPACYLGYLHPVLNCDGHVYPCDSCVLNRDAHHKFAEPWRICRWDEIDGLYRRPARSLISDPGRLCPGCVFTRSNVLLHEVRAGAPIPPPGGPMLHPNFI